MKTFVYLLNEKYFPLPNSFVRTESMQDGNCFYHCILMAIRPHYKSLHDHYKTEQVIEFRQKCAEALDFDSYRDLGEIVKVRFNERFHAAVDDGSYLDGFDDDRETTQILKEILNPNLMKALLDKTTGEPFCTAFSQHAIKAVSTFKNTTLNNALPDFLLTLFNTIHQQCFQGFKKEIETYGVYAESYHMKWISKFIETNIVVIDDKTNCVYSGIDTLMNYDGSRPSILLLWRNNNHFENLGELCNEMLVKRVFTDQDIVIQRLKKDLV